MKYKFSPQKAVLVAGVLAVSYAQACYYASTGVICFTSGTTVDEITFPNPNPNLSAVVRPVIATQDWYYGLGGNPPPIIYEATGHGTGASNATQTNSIYHCTGAAQFYDFAGATITVNWVNQSVDFNLAVPWVYTTMFLGTTSGSTCN